MVWNSTPLKACYGPCGFRLQHARMGGPESFRLFLPVRLLDLLERCSVEPELTSSFLWLFLSEPSLSARKVRRKYRGRMTSSKAEQPGKLEEPILDEHIASLLSLSILVS